MPATSASTVPYLQWRAYRSRSIILPVLVRGSGFRCEPTPSPVATDSSRTIVSMHRGSGASSNRYERGMDSRLCRSPLRGASEAGVLLRRLAPEGIRICSTDRALRSGRTSRCDQPKFKRRAPMPAIGPERSPVRSLDRPQWGSQRTSAMSILAWLWSGLCRAFADLHWSYRQPQWTDVPSHARADVAGPCR